MKSVNSLHRSYAIAKFLTYFALIVGALIMIFPFVWMVLTSFKTQAESVSIPATFFPSEFRLDGYKKVLENLPIAFSSMAGYAFAKLKFRGKNILFTIVLMQMSLPSQIFIIPQYQMVAKLGLVNTIAGLVFPGLVSAFGVFFLRQTYMGIPEAYDRSVPYLPAPVRGRHCRYWRQIKPAPSPLCPTAPARKHRGCWFQTADPNLALPRKMLYNHHVIFYFSSEEGPL